MPHANILVVEDDTELRSALTRSLAASGYGVTPAADAEEGLRQFDPTRHGVVISDLCMPGIDGFGLLERIKEVSPATPVVMISGRGSIGQAVQAVRAGAEDFLPKPFSREQLTATLERITTRHSGPQPTLDPPEECPLITRDPRMVGIVHLAAQIATTDATILIQGESGTGKELLARWIHVSSARASKPFVAVNCAALPETLLESELFGHERGAFTGADSRHIGRFEQADGGTLVLDEIGEMGLALQTKLLRVLQEREIDRVGGRGPIKIDIRVIAITNRNLAQEVKEGRFREDLYYRLRVIPIEVPALRQRGDDWKLLVEKLLNRYARHLGRPAPRMSPAALDMFARHGWPGNVRELDNVVHRATILAANGVIQPEHVLLENPLADEAPPTPHAVSEVSPRMTVHEMERRLILAALDEFGGNRTQAAKSLGISIRTLRNKIREYRSLAHHEAKVAQAVAAGGL